MRGFAGWRLLLLAPLLAAWGDAVAQTAMQPAGQPMRLEDAIRVGLGGGPALQREDERVNRAAARLQQAQGAFDWQALADTGWERLYVPQSRGGFLTESTETIDAWRTTVGIGRKFRNGIEIKPGVTIYAETGGASAGQTLGQTRTRPTIGLTVPLLRGLGESGTGSPEQAAQEAVNAAQSTRNFAAQKAVHDMVQSYWHCLAATRHVELLSVSEQNARDYMEWLRRLADTGQIERTVLQRAEASHAMRHVEIGKAEEALRGCRRSLALVAGGAPTPVGEFPAIESAGPAVDQLTESGLLELALAQREDLQALDRMIVAERARLRGAQDGSWPKLELYADVNRGGLRYTQSLGRNLEKGQMAEASAAESEARLNRQQAETQIKSELQDALGQLAQARSIWFTLAGSIRLLDQVLADTRRRVAAGTTDRKEYRDIQDQATQARRQMIDANLQFASALAALRLATGTITTGNQASSSDLAGRFVTPPTR